MINALMEKYRKFPKQVKASFWFVVCGFLQKAISLLTTPIQIIIYIGLWCIQCFYHMGKYYYYYCILKSGLRGISAGAH